MARWRDAGRDPEVLAVNAAADVTGWHPGSDRDLRDLVLLLAGED